MMLLSIQSWWQALSEVQQIYWGIAIIASVLFFIQLLFSFIGLDSDLDMDIDDGDPGIGIFSIRGIISFFMFFGWGGIVSLNVGFGAPQVLMIAFLIGFLAMVAVAYVFSKMLALQETGTVNIESALGKSAEVYLTIPSAKGGIGKIHLTLAGKIMEFDAVTTGHQLNNGTMVTITRIGVDNIMLVEAN